MAEKDYYETLGVPPDADQAAIKDAFRNLALKYHPDRNKEPGAEARFKDIAEAYAVLSDPQKRRRYDAAGAAGLSGISAEDLFAGIDLEDVFGGFARDFGFGESIFERFFRTARPRRGRDIEMVVEVPLAQIATGGTHRLEIPHPIDCPRCEGSGAEPPTQPRTCPDCDGSGTKVSRRSERNVTVQQITTCTSCGGSGRLIDTPCRDCGGRGRIERLEELSLRIPIGIEEGTALGVPGRGEPGGADSPPGDLLVIVRSAPDRRFRRRRTDLWHTEVVPVEDAALGASIEVPTLEEPVTVVIPSGTQPGQILRVAGKGLPAPGGGRPGDLMLVIEVEVPRRPDEEERRLFEQLRRLHRQGDLQEASQ